MLKYFLNKQMVDWSQMLRQEALSSDFHTKRNCWEGKERKNGAVALETPAGSDQLKKILYSVFVIVSDDITYIVFSPQFLCMIFPFEFTTTKEASHQPGLWPLRLCWHNA